MKNHILSLVILLIIAVAGTALVTADFEKPAAKQDSLSLITDTPEEGFQLAITLSRKGVTSTQPNKDILFSLRDKYSTDADALIASSQVIAIHYQTIAAANDYWRH